MHYSNVHVTSVKGTTRRVLQERITLARTYGDDEIDGVHLQKIDGLNDNRDFDVEVRLY